MIVLFLHFFSSARQIKLTYVSLRAHVKIASRIVSATSRSALPRRRLHGASTSRVFAQHSSTGRASLISPRRDVTLPAGAAASTANISRCLFADPSPSRDRTFLPRTPDPSEIRRRIAVVCPPPPSPVRCLGFRVRGIKAVARRVTVWVRVWS